MGGDDGPRMPCGRGRPARLPAPFERGAPGGGRMALTAIDIYKRLPKTNCRECGQSTCLAFAMQIAAGKASIDLCPPASEEAREKLSAAAAPPLPKVTIQIEKEHI